MAGKAGTEIQVPLEYDIPEDMPCQYATNLVVQHTEHEFILSFFRASPPFLLGSQEDIERQLSEIKSIRADCVARVIIATSKMPEFVDALAQNLDRFVGSRKYDEGNSK